MSNSDLTLSDALLHFLKAPVPRFDTDAILSVRMQTAVLASELFRADPAHVAQIAEPIFRDYVFPFFSSNGAAALRYAVQQREKLFADASHDVAAELLETFPALLELAASQPLARWIAESGLELIGRGGKRLEFEPNDMNKTSLQFALLGIGIAAGFVALWDWLRATPEFTQIARRFGRERWARKLLRRGPLLAARSQWNLAAAWEAAEQSGALDDGEVRDAIHALSAEPDGRRISPAAGSPFDGQTMDTRSRDARFVAAVIAEGLEWNRRPVLKARVDAGTADYVAVRRLTEGARKQQLLGALSCDLEPGVVLHKAAIDDVLDAMSNPSEADVWLTEFLSVWPPGTVELIEPKKDEPLDERTMRSTKALDAPQHALVETVRHRGLRRIGGEVLVRARVETRQAAAAKRLI